MKLNLIWLVFIFGVGLSYAALTSAAESVGTSSSLKKVGDLSSANSATLSILEKIERDFPTKQFVERFVMKNSRRLHGCVGPFFEKDAPTKSTPPSGMTCKDLFAYESAIAKSEDLAKICKRGCIEEAKGAAKGNSATALEKCNTDACEKKCDFKNASFKVELDSFIRGAIAKNRDKAEAL